MYTTYRLQNQEILNRQAFVLNFLHLYFTFINFSTLKNSQQKSNISLTCHKIVWILLYQYVAFLNIYSAIKCTYTLSFSSCLDQVWHILFQNILLKQEEIGWLEENFHLCFKCSYCIPFLWSFYGLFTRM
jgi:hypothetical protein